MSLHKKIEEFEKIAKILDSGMSIGPIKFGIDPIIGLIPVVGDALPLIFSAYLLRVAIQEHLPKLTIIHIILNMIVDWLVGSIPIIGDIWDFFFRSYSRNLKLLKAAAQKIQ